MREEVRKLKQIVGVLLMIVTNVICRMRKMRAPARKILIKIQTRMRRSGSCLVCLNSP